MSEIFLEQFVTFFSFIRCRRGSCKLADSVTPAEAGVQKRLKGLDSDFRRGECAWKQARSERCKSSRGRCPLPVVKGNCVVVRRGGEQPEANLQSVEPAPDLIRG
jgi:hypothetical protein